MPLIRHTHQMQCSERLHLAKEASAVNISELIRPVDQAKLHLWRARRS
jgi:hypothetical protein